MVSEINKNKCTGCGVCILACPVKCITLKPDSEGFLYPEIDSDACINCGKCDKACHVLHIENKESDQPEVFIAYNKNEDYRKNSSSGGIFISLATKILEQNGTVYGAAIGNDLRVEHIRVNSKQEISRLQGSKYVQSYISSEIYAQVQDDLKSGKSVLYSGTPCQIGALRKHLSAPVENLTTVSFICHGVPSPSVWHKYTEYQKKKFSSDINSVSFRAKDYGWTDFSMKLEFENGKSYCQKLNTDPYLQSFLKNTCLRPSCHACSYKGKERLTGNDIMLADKWGTVPGNLPDITDNKGISVVFVQTENGKKLWDSVSEQFYYDFTDYTSVINCNTAYFKSAVASKHRESFFNDLNNVPFDVLYKKYAKTPALKILKKNMFTFAFKCCKKLGIVAVVKKIMHR